MLSRSFSACKAFPICAVSVQKHMVQIQHSCLSASTKIHSIIAELMLYLVSNLYRCLCPLFGMHPLYWFQHLDQRSTLHAEAFLFRPREPESGSSLLMLTILPALWARYTIWYPGDAIWLMSFLCLRKCRQTFGAALFVPVSNFFSSMDSPQHFGSTWSVTLMHQQHWLCKIFEKKYSPFWRFNLSTSFLSQIFARSRTQLWRHCKQWRLTPDQMRYCLILILHQFLPQELGLPCAVLGVPVKQFLMRPSKS